MFCIVSKSGSHHYQQRTQKDGMIDNMSGVGPMASLQLVFRMVVSSLKFPSKQCHSVDKYKALLPVGIFRCRT